MFVSVYLAYCLYDHDGEILHIKALYLSNGEDVLMLRVHFVSSGP